MKKLNKQQRHLAYWFALLCLEEEHSEGRRNLAICPNLWEYGEVKHEKLFFDFSEFNKQRPIMNEKNYSPWWWKLKDYNSRQTALAKALHESK